MIGIGVIMEYKELYRTWERAHFILLGVGCPMCTKGLLEDIVLWILIIYQGKPQMVRQHTDTSCPYQLFMHIIQKLLIGCPFIFSRAYII